jgi:sugar lactone lactonase YvrE
MPLPHIEPATVKSVELMVDCRTTIGESPTWSADEGALYWVDIKEPALHRLAADGKRRKWQVESDIGAFALLDNAVGAVVALRSGLFRLDFATESTALLAKPPFDVALFRFNEGICDVLGRFWIGVMFDPVTGSGTQLRDRCALHHFTFGRGLVAAEDQSDLHNGFAWNRSNSEFFWAHSNVRRVYRATYDLATGAIGQPEPFASIGGEKQLPDGAAMDEEGCYWCAVHGASVLHRYDCAGRLVSQVPLPVSQPTMCAFIGSNLEDMVVTSARGNLSPSQLAREPYAGGLFRLHPGVRGLLRPCVVH